MGNSLSESLAADAAASWWGNRLLDVSPRTRRIFTEVLCTGVMEALRASRGNPEMPNVVLGRYAQARPGVLLRAACLIARVPLTAIPAETVIMWVWCSGRVTVETGDELTGEVVLREAD